MDSKKREIQEREDRIHALEGQLADLEEAVERITREKEEELASKERVIQELQEEMLTIR
jgi:hypothetical protein